MPSSNVEEPQTPSSFKVNDTVLAKWVSGDKAFYPARITSITGSSAAPVYIVTFKSYGNSDTVRGNDIKPISNESKKRKADDSPATQSSPTVAANTGVISAAANINPDLASQVRKEPSKVSDGPPRPAKVPRKVKANKELEAGKNKWQEFTNKGKLAKTAKKESMFRTGESYNARGELSRNVVPEPNRAMLSACLLDQSASPALARRCAKIQVVRSTYTAHLMTSQNNAPVTISA